MGTIRNGSTLIVVFDTRNGSCWVVFAHFILILFVDSDFIITFAGKCRKRTIMTHLTDEEHNKQMADMKAFDER